MSNRRFMTALFIAWRHLFSKKKHSIVNIISIISAVGVLSGTAALIIVLSVFNGMENLVVNSFNSFNPDLKITLKEGKSFAMDSFPLEKLRKIDGVKAVEEVVSDLVLVEYQNKQHLIELKGVSKTYAQNSGFDTLIIDGDFALQQNGCEAGVMGEIAAGMLQVNLNGADLYKVYYPKRLRKNLGDPMKSFNTNYLTPSGVFSSFTDYDSKFLICSINFSRTLMSYEDEATSVEIYVKNAKKTNHIQEEVQNIVGDKFLVQNRFQQEEMLFKTMHTEKLMIFVILAFILLIAIFNIIGTLAMIIIEKQEDTQVLNYLGADKSLIRRIFMMEGMIISFVGGLVGMILGFVVCMIQQAFHVIPLGDGTSNYIVDYYPVKIEGIDFLIVFATIFIISLIISAIPIQQINHKKTNQL